MNIANGVIELVDTTIDYDKKFHRYPSLCLFMPDPKINNTIEKKVYTFKQVAHQYQTANISALIIYKITTIKQLNELKDFISFWHISFSNEIIIYTELTEEEVNRETSFLYDFGAIIVKFNKPLESSTRIFDLVLGVYLSSSNQYAKRLECKKLKPKHLYYVETHIVDHCNLNCVGCFHYAPLAPKHFYNFDQFKNEIAKLYELFGDTICFNILGGEPLLHPQFLDFCKETKKYFTHVRTISNGLLLKDMPQSFFDTFNSLDIETEITNYTGAVWLEDLVNEKLPNAILVSKPSMSTQFISLEQLSNDKYAIFETCQHYHCVTLRDGYLYRCCLEAWSDFLFNYFNKWPKNYNREQDRISLITSTADDINKFVCNPVEFCKYCNMVNANGSKWYVSKKELNEWVTDNSMIFD